MRNPIGICPNCRKSIIELKKHHGIATWFFKCKRCGYMTVTIPQDCSLRPEE